MEHLPTESIVGTCPKCKAKVGILKTLLDGWTMMVEAKSLHTNIELMHPGDSIAGFDPYWSTRKHRPHKCRKKVKEESTEFRRQADLMLGKNREDKT